MVKIAAADADQCKKEDLGRRSQTQPPLGCGLEGELAWGLMTVMGKGGLCGLEAPGLV